VILASARPYFHAMFTKFSETNHDPVVIRQLDSTLQLLVNFIYSGEIMITKKNVQVIIDKLLLCFKQTYYLNSFRLFLKILLNT